MRLSASTTYRLPDDRNIGPSTAKGTRSPGRSRHALIFEFDVLDEFGKRKIITIREPVEIASVGSPMTLECLAPSLTPSAFPFNETSAFSYQNISTYPHTAPTQYRKKNYSHADPKNVFLAFVDSALNSSYRGRTRALCRLKSMKLRISKDQNIVRAWIECKEGKRSGDWILVGNYSPLMARGQVKFHVALA